MNPTPEETLKRLDEIAAELQSQGTVSQPPVTGSNGDGRRLDVPAYCSHFGIEIVKTKDAPGGGTMHCLKHCVFDENHGPNESAIIQQPTGKLIYQCFHNSCSGRRWRDARQVISGGQALAAFMVDRNGHHRTAKTVAPIDDGEGEALRAEDRSLSDPADQEAGKIVRFEFIHNAVILANLRQVEWLIEGILTNYALYYNFGDPGSFKTFVELDRLLHIASGLEYHGHKVKQGPVFYICGEGYQGIGRRIAAWHIAHKTKPEDVPFFISRMPTQLMDLNHLNEVRQQVDLMAKKHGPPAVIQLDTLARNFGAGDENSTADMTKAISNLDNAFGTGFCRGLTHHTGHSNKDRARGAMALHGAADAAFRISVTQTGQILVECKKLKDAPAPPPMLFNRRAIPLQIGDVEDRSFVLDLAAEGEEAVEIAKPVEAVKLNKEREEALKVLRQLCKQYFEENTSVTHVPYKEWRKACLANKIYKRSDAFLRAAKTLYELKLVTYDDVTKTVYINNEML